MTRRASPQPRDAYHHGDLRRALIAATLKLIEEEDVSVVSLREVARRAGVSYAAPYHHFRDKAALLAAVGEEGFHMLAEQMATALSRIGDRPATARVAALMSAYFTFATSHSAHYSVMFLPEFADRELYVSFHETAGRCLDLVVEVVGQAHPGAPLEEIATLAVAAWATGHGLASLVNKGGLQAKPGLPPTQQLVQAVMERVAGMVGTSRSPPELERGRSRGLKK